MKDYTNYHNSNFKDRMTYFGQLVFEKSLNGFEGEDVEIDSMTQKVIIQEHSNPLNAEKIDKKILCSLNSLIKWGSIVNWKEEKYLVISKPIANMAYIKAKIVECNADLKWQDNYGQIHSYPCIASKNPFAKIDTDEIKGLTFLENSLYVFVPRNNETLEINIDKRFIIGRQVFKIVGFDDVSDKGIIQFNMNKDEINNLDNFENGIANYQTPNFSLVIKNSDINLKPLETLQLQIELKNNELLLPSPALSYLSSDENIVTVSDTGLVTAVANGETNITVSWENNGDFYSDMIKIVVSDVVVNNYSITIEGTDSIKQNQSATFTAHILNNGIEVADKAVVWSIDNTNGTITESTDTTCVVKACKDANVYFKVIATLSDDNSVVGEKEIKVITLW